MSTQRQVAPHLAGAIITSARCSAWGNSRLILRATPSHPGLALSRTVRIPWFPDPPCVLTVAEALVQVAMHTQHHRGQCMTRLKDFGGEPKNVDWIIWLWKLKPQGRWS